jgi:hypothetical protein
MIGKRLRWNTFYEREHKWQLFPYSWACQKLCLILILPLWHPLHRLGWILALGHAKEFTCVGKALAPFTPTLVFSKMVNLLLVLHPPNMEFPSWIPCRTFNKIWTLNFPWTFFKLTFFTYFTYRLMVHLTRFSNILKIFLTLEIQQMASFNFTNCVPMW